VIVQFWTVFLEERMKKILGVALMVAGLSFVGISGAQALQKVDRKSGLGDRTATSLNRNTLKIIEGYKKSHPAASMRWVCGGGDGPSGGWDEGGCNKNGDTSISVFHVGGGCTCCG
jgi:hypothetical protein